MKKVICSFAVAAAFGLAGTFVMAQEQAPAPGQTNGTVQDSRTRPAVDPTLQAQHMAKKLKLSVDQQNQLGAILTSRRDQMSSVHSDSTLSPADRHSKMQSIRGESESKIRALLTDDQKQSYDQMQQQRRDRQQSHKGHADASATASN